MGYIKQGLATFGFTNDRIASVECSEYVERAEVKSVKERLIETFRECG